MPDLALLRDDLAAFAELVGEPLEPWQAEALAVHARPQRETAVVGPRRSGKSRGAALVALHHCFRGRERHALIVSSSEEGAKRLLDAARRIATRSRLLAGSVVDEQSHRLTLSNGSTLRCTAATDAAVRGWSASLVIADEASLISDDVLTGAARPIIASEPDGRFLLISSALRAAGAFFDAIRRGEAGSPHTAAFKWRLVDCHWISATEVEAARASMSAVRFSAEYETAFAGMAGQLIPQVLLDRATLDYAPVSDFQDLPTRAKLAAGLDWGWAHDSTAAVVLGRVYADGPAVFGVVAAKAWPSGADNALVIEELRSSPASFVSVAAEVNGIGGPLSRDLFAAMRRRPVEVGGAAPLPRYVVIEEGGDGDVRWRRSRRNAGEGFSTALVPVTTTAPLKAAAFASLSAMMARGSLVIPRDAEDLRRQLATLTVEITAGGGERIEAASGHDDLPMALCMAMRPYRGRDGAWRTWLDELSRREGRREVSPRLGRWPTWRSVVGDEVSESAAPEPEPPRDPRWDPVRARLEELEAISAEARERSTNGE